MQKEVFAFVALGANLGNAQATIRAVLVDLSQLPYTKMLAQSSLYQSPPFGQNADGPDYINAVVKILTTLTPHELLCQLQQLERQHGRERHYQNAPRTLDLDIILYGDLCINDEQLIIPHPRMNERAFVLLPLNEIDANLSWHALDGTKQTIQDLLPNITMQVINQIKERI